jgi:hypothetical protein
MQCFLIKATVGALIAASLCGSVRAETKIGDTLALEGQVVCDTENEIQQIADIDRETKGRGVADLLRAFQHVPNSKGEPTCTVQRIEGVIVERKDIGRIWMPDGREANGFLLHLQGEAEEFWIMEANLLPPSI